MRTVTTTAAQALEFRQAGHFTGDGLAVNQASRKARTCPKLTYTQSKTEIDGIEWPVEGKQVGASLERQTEIPGLLAK
jgi:hypothetical protein